MTLYQGKLFNFLLKMTSSREDAEEITQEVFIKVYNNLYKYNNRWSFSTWIYRIAINTLRSEYRKAKNVKSVDYYTNVSELPANFSDYPELAYEMKERQKEIIKLIDELKEDQKQRCFYDICRIFLLKKSATYIEEVSCHHSCFIMRRPGRFIMNS